VVVKATIVTFKKPVKILQVFSNIVYYSKEDKSFADRKHKLEWRDAESVSGYIADQQLFLPELVLAHPALQRCSLITMVDDQTIAHQHHWNIAQNDCLVLDVPRPFGDFNLAQKEELELHLRYQPLSTAKPNRPGFKISDLRKGEPVEVKINGKYDHSLFGSPRARVFKEEQYIFQYIGDFTSLQVIRPQATPMHKRIPENRKLVNLLKPLW
jgi:hypothetical protein